MPLQRFVPNLLRRLLAYGEPDDTPHADPLAVALLFADISGFTALMEHHVRRGPAGLEDMTRILGDYFERIIVLVTSQGGDVMGFAGDALSVVWTAADDPEGLAGACTRASQCALAVQQQVREAKTSVSMRVALCAGQVQLLRVGGDRDSRHAFMIGDAVTQLAPTLKLAQPGEVAISHEARAALAARLYESSSRSRVLKPTSLIQRVPDRPLVTVEVAPEHNARLVRYVPRLLRQTLAAAGPTTEWLAQFRQISAMFVRMPVPEPARERWLEDYHQLVLELQRVIYKFGGRIDKIASEEKGILMLAVWGVPGATHEDDPLRAVQAAVLLRELLVQRNQPVAIGVATGRAYCGLIGGDTRSEYTIVGTVVNLAARIMQQADGVLCDEVTRSAAEERVDFAEGRPLTIRGIAAKVVASEPILVRGTLRRRHAEIELIGRGDELSSLRRCVDELVMQRRGRATIILGKPGIGKSRMLSELRRIAVQRGVMVFEAAGDAVELDAPYTAIRPIVAALLSRSALAAGPTSSASSTFAAASVGDEAPGLAQLLESDPELAERAPLLTAILPCGLAETDFTRGLAPETRAGLLHSLVAALVRRQTTTHPVLILLDDVHWFDSASLSLVRALTKTVDEVLFALAVRPQAAGLSAELDELRREEHTTLLPLEGLADDAVLAMMARCLGVTPEGLSGPLLTTIREKSEGNPLFIEQLALSLLERGHVEVKDGTLRVPTRSGTLPQISLPGTIHGILNSRLDQLPAEQQFFLKVACVLGRVFDLRLARDIYPKDQAPADLERVAEALAAQGILVPADRDSGLWQFRHTTTIEAIYETMLFSQRREIHRAVAEWYERKGEGALDHLALLAHHWSRAEDSPRARRYLDLAGARALERFANVEAVRLLEQLLALVAAERVETDPDTAARWREQLCEAHFRIGDMQASLRHGLDALALLGVSMPVSSFGMFGALMRLILERNLSAVPRRFPPGVGVDERARRLRALKVQRRLTDVYGYLVNVAGFLLSACRELALADVCDQRGAAACARMMLYFIVSVTPMKRTAEALVATTLALIEREPDRALVATALGRVAVARMQSGDFVEAERRMLDARALATVVGDLRALSELFVLFGLWSTYRGLFARAERHFEELGAASDFSGDEQFAVWALIGRAGCMEAQGRAAEATKLVTRAVPWLEEKAAPTTYIWGQGVRALVTLRAGDREAAAELVRKVLGRLRKEKVLAAYWMLGGIESICVVSRELVASADPRERAALVKIARECDKFLALFGKTLPFGAASAAYHQAALASALGRRERELAALRRCLALAAKIDALHLLEGAYGRLAALAPDSGQADAARAQAADAARRRSLAELPPSGDARD